jgi:hypothetical protein
VPLRVLPQENAKAQRFAKRIKGIEPSTLLRMLPQENAKAQRFAKRIEGIEPLFCCVCSLRKTQRRKGSQRELKALISNQPIQPPKIACSDLKIQHPAEF